MDWSKTKTIFIVVFSILNVFLYSVYINNYNEEQKLEVIDGANVENDLKNANITMPKMPATAEKISYISGKIDDFSNFDFSKVSSNQIVTIRDNMVIEGMMKTPEKLSEISAQELTDFIDKTVYKADEYELWNIDKKAREATFFQVTNDKSIFYNQSASIKVYWSAKKEVTHYEQTMFESIKSVGEKSSYIKPMQAIKTIFEKGYLKDYTEISLVELGYSTLVPLTETQVLSPTWHIRALIPGADGEKATEKDFFINAIDNQILEIEKNIDFKSKDNSEIEYNDKQ